MIISELEEIFKERKMQRVSWNKLAEPLPITGNALRTAFSRGSINDVYLDAVRKVLNIKTTHIAHNKPISNSIGDRLFNLLEEKGLTPYKLFKKTNISQSTLSRIINKNSIPNESNMKVLVDFFNIDKQWFLTGNEQNHLKPFLTNCQINNLIEANKNLSEANKNLSEANKILSKKL